MKNSIRTKLPKPEDDSNKAEFGGTVNFLVGHDSNIDPNKSGVSGTFYQLDPTLTFKKGNFDGKVGAMIKDYSDQEISDTNKQTEASAQLNYTFNLTKELKATSTIDGIYHDEKWPDYINGLDVNDVDHGMPIRYTDAKFTEALTYDFGNGFTTQVGGYAEHQEASDLYTDWAPDELGQLRFKPSFNQYSGFARVGYQINDTVELALRPSITDKKYTAREARQGDGTPGGVTIAAPLYEVVDSEMDFDVNFKFGNTTITPTIMGGQQSDPIYGALDGTYYGGGLMGKIEVNFPMKVIITPSVIYKTTHYDNWTYQTENPGELRIDSDLTAGISGTLMLTKNIGLLVNYSKTHNLSTYTDPSEGYNEEIVSTGAMFTF